MKEWPLISAGLFLFIVVCNPKTRVFGVIKEQLNIYKNDKTGEYSVWDMFCFIIAPIFIAFFIAKNLPIDVIIRNADVIITVFSLIATLPLSFLALFVDKMLTEEKEKEVAREVFVSITVDIVYSMLIIGLVIVAKFMEVSTICEQVAVAILAFLVIKIALNILMIMKRIFAIWDVINN